MLNCDLNFLELA